MVLSGFPKSSQKFLLHNSSKMYMSQYPSKTLSQHFVSLVTYIVWAFVSLVWLTLGLAVWIPLVCRSTIFLAVAIPLDSFTDNDGYTAVAAKMLKSYIELYPDGFEIITNSIYSEVSGSSNKTDWQDDWLVILRELASAAIFWYIVAWLAFDFSLL